MRKKFKDVAIVSKDGTVEYINMGNPAFFGYREEDLIGKKFTQVYSNVDENTSTFMRAINNGERFIDYEQILWTEDNRIVRQVEDVYILKDGNRVEGAIEFADYDETKDEVKKIERSYETENDDYSTKGVGCIVGQCDAIKILRSKIEKICDRESPVLIMGATGTGKELVARVIHGISNRAKKPFIYVNCSALPENLLEGMLFGIKEGSFTDAREKTGMFELANEGTLFLDEMDSMPLSIQPKILKAIEEKTVRPIGSNEDVYLNVNIIASCNKCTSELLESKSFRSDLFFRLSVIPFEMPVLSERGEDVILLTEYYMQKYNEKYNKTIKTLSEEAKELLLQHSWPGNVRELINLVESIYATINSDVISKENILQNIMSQEIFKKTSTLKDFLSSGMTLTEYMKNYEREVILREFSRNEENITRTAEAIGITPQVLKYKLKSFLL